MTSEHKDEAKRFAETARRSREQLEKQGTPDYDPREHMRVVDEHRKVGEQLKGEESQREESQSEESQSGES